MLVLVCCLALIAVNTVFAGNVAFTDCGARNVRKVNITNCDTDPCIFQKGKEVQFIIEFISNQDTIKADFTLFFKISNVEVQVPGLESNACVAHLPCPLKVEDVYTFTYSAFIPKSVASTNSDLTAKLVGERGTLACASFRGSIQD